MPPAISLLIVEDNVRFLKKLVGFISEAKNIKILDTSTNGDDAVSKALSLKPDCILLDLELPGISGIEVIEKLKPSLASTEILVLTSFDDETRVYESIRNGASGYLVKGASASKIIRGIEDVAEGGSVIEPRIARRLLNYFKSVETPLRDESKDKLTEIEKEVLQMVAKGLSNPETGKVLSIERRTVRTHLGHIYEKLGAASRVEAVTKGLKLGLISL